MINLNRPIQTHKAMSAVLAIDFNPTHVRKQTLSHKVEVGMQSLIFVTITLVTIISLAFLANANRNATKGYALKTLELERSRLLTETEVWNMQIAKVQSLTSLKNDPAIQRMVRVNQPKFVRGDTAIASR